jgi:hypothetical protein
MIELDDLHPVMDVNAHCRRVEKEREELKEMLFDLILFNDDFKHFPLKTMNWFKKEMAKERKGATEFKLEDKEND